MMEKFPCPIQGTRDIGVREHETEAYKRHRRTRNVGRTTHIDVTRHVGLTRDIGVQETEV